MEQYSEWLNENILHQELNNYSFGEISNSTIGEYRKGRRMPKLQAHKEICKVLNYIFNADEYFEFKKNFIRNEER